MFCVSDVGLLPLVYRATQFLRPNETYHVPTRMFYEKEVLRGTEQIDGTEGSMMGKCLVLYIKDYLKSISARIAAKDTFLCESRYSVKQKNISPIKSWHASVIEQNLIARRKPLTQRELKRVKSAFADQKYADETKTPVVMVAGTADTPYEPDERSIKMSKRPEDANKKDTYYEVLYYDGVPYCRGECVYLRNEMEEPFISRLDLIWVDRAGEPWFSGCWFLRPAETTHFPTAKFFEREVMRGTIVEINSLRSVIAKCAVLNQSEYVTWQPLDISSGDVFICISKYLEGPKQIHRMKSKLDTSVS